jgi:NhaP-type Na+/H+ or K+/H+ antiporter
VNEAAAGLAGLLLVFVLYATVARRLDRVSVTSAIVFTVAGILLGTEGLDILPLSLGAESTKLLAESALAVLLFADASTVDVREARRDAGLIGRLLLIGLPLAIVAGTLAAAGLLPEMSWAACVLLAAVLAPTDAALGLAVFGNRAVPARVRRVLNVESGLNDGLATPIVFFMIAVVIDEATSGSTAILSEAARRAVVDLTLGVGVGAAAGGLGGLLLVWGRSRNTTTAGSEEIGVLALAALSYVGAVALGVNGFVAAFVGGLAFGALTRGAMRDRTGVTDAAGQVLAVLVWVVFGSLLAGPVLLGDPDWRSIAYAALSLTLVRMVPVAISLLGTGLRPASMAFMGWFGPRGMASVVFILVVVIELEPVAPEMASVIATTGAWTILFSVILHGVTAGPLGRMYGARAERFPASAPERAEVSEPRMRGAT